MEIVVFVVLSIIVLAFICYGLVKFVCLCIDESNRCPQCGSSDTIETSRVWNMSFSETVTHKCRHCGHTFKYMICD